MIPKFPVSVKAIIQEDGKFLMIEGLWDGKPSRAFPGGLVEGGESLEDALVREVEEETGLRIEVGNLKFATKYKHPKGGENVGLYFSAKIIGGEIKLGGEPNAVFTNLIWLSKDELPDWVRSKIAEYF